MPFHDTTSRAPSVNIAHLSLKSRAPQAAVYFIMHACSYTYTHRSPSVSM